MSSKLIDGHYKLYSMLIVSTFIDGHCKLYVMLSKLIDGNYNTIS